MAGPTRPGLPFALAREEARRARAFLLRVQFTNVGKIKPPYLLLKSCFANSLPTSRWLL